jgi:hypothetical protein
MKVPSRVKPGPLTLRCGASGDRTVISRFHVFDFQIHSKLPRLTLTKLGGENIRKITQTLTVGGRRE